MRFKKRYFCVEINPIVDGDANKVTVNCCMNSNIKQTTLSEEIHKSIEKFYGDLGMATMMPSFGIVYFNTVTNLAILRIARDLKVKFYNLLTFIRKLDSVDVHIRVVHVSGSIKKCKKYLVQYCNAKLNQLALDHTKRAPQPDDVIVEVQKLLTSCQENNENFY